MYLQLRFHSKEEEEKMQLLKKLLLITVRHACHEHQHRAESKLALGARVLRTSPDHAPFSIPSPLVDAQVEAVVASPSTVGSCREVAGTGRRNWEFHRILLLAHST